MEAVVEGLQELHQRATSFLEHRQQVNNHIAEKQPEWWWQRPPVRMIKCNIDSSFTDNYVGVGMCLSDEVGNFLQDRTDRYSPRLLVHEEHLVWLKQSSGL